MQRESAPYGQYGVDGDGPAAQAGDYTCPMHPEVRQPGPGKCPKCGMFLQPAGAASGHAAHGHGHTAHDHHVAAPPPSRTASHDGKDVEYTCPMHPQIRQMGPGHCPICGMALDCNGRDGRQPRAA
jgi:P-type Cu+ transporter